MEKAKIGLIQFQLSAPKPDVGITIPDQSEDLTSSADGQHCDN